MSDATTIQVRDQREDGFGFEAGSVGLAGYEHQPLPHRRGSSDNFHLRIAILRPGKGGDPIHVTLRPESFSDDSVPYYEALSYAWGSSAGPRRRILLDTALGNVSSVTDAHLPRWFDVHQNLYEALRQLRRTKEPRYLWTDALCINQVDDGEKSVQVERMGDVYERASRVRVWLGSADHESDEAMRILQSLGEQVEFDLDHLILRSRKDAADPSLGDPLVANQYSEREWRSLLHFFNRDYFSRFWIRQELALPNPDVMTVHCGARSMSWPVFRAAWWSLDVKAKPADIPAAVLVRERFREIYSCFMMSRRGKLTFKDMRFLYQSCKCQNPRDRVYALLRFLLPGVALKIRPDYSKSVEQVYTDATVADLRDDSPFGVDILAECEYDEGWKAPSWVPNWNVPSGHRAKVRGNSFAAWPFPASLKLELLRGVLVTTGVQIGVIESARQMGFEGDDSDALDQKVAQFIKDILGEDARAERPLRTFCASALDDILRCLCGDYFVEFADLGGSLPLPSLVAVRKHIYCRLSSTSIEADVAEALEAMSSWRRFCDEVLHFSSGQLFFHTAEGYMGVCSPAGQVGDVACVIPGCVNPLLLRRRPDVRNRAYNIVGAAFMASFSHSEAFLGPLDEGTQRIWRRAQADVVFRTRMSSDMASCHTVDPIDGEWTPEDPRLARLGDDLTNYREAVRRDPWACVRVDAATWEKAGVDMTTFELV
jgi:hypothetical protein